MKADTCISVRKELATCVKIYWWDNRNKMLKYQMVQWIQLLPLQHHHLIKLHISNRRCCSYMVGKKSSTEACYEPWNDQYSLPKPLTCPGSYGNISGYQAFSECRWTHKSDIQVFQRFEKSCMGLHVCLPVLSRLSLIVQRRDIDLTIIEPTLQNTLSALDKFKTTKGLTLQHYLIM